jgi:DNA-binding CsgD family transcriptional regulator
MARLPRSSASDSDEVGPQSLGEEHPFGVSDLTESDPAQTPQTHAALQPTAGDPLGSHNRNASLRCGTAPSDVLVALTYGLDLVQHGAMLVAAEGLPRLANGAAMTILQKREGLWLEKTGLVTDRATDTRLLRKLLQDAIKEPELGEPKDSPITLQRRTAHSALIVRVVPGPGLECWPGAENRTALLKLYDQDIGLQVDAGDLCRLYGLTRGEAALAVRLVQGKSIDDAAAELFISPHTARTHLKRIFMKTDTHRQAELAVRILTVVL